MFNPPVQPDGVRSGKLRASVETALGLNQGDLAERKVLGEDERSFMVLPSQFDVTIPVHDLFYFFSGDHYLLGFFLMIHEKTTRKSLMFIIINIY